MQQDIQAVIWRDFPSNQTAMRLGGCEGLHSFCDRDIGRKVGSMWSYIRASSRWWREEVEAGATEQA